MFDYIRDVGAFHAKFGLDGVEQVQPKFMSHELQKYRLGFLLEELLEYAEAVGFELDIKVSKDGKTVENMEWTPSEEPKYDLAKALDGMVDLQYVLSGTARFHGFGTPVYDKLLSQRVRVFDGAWHRVHSANMRKVRATSSEQSKRGSTFDVIKPQGWLAPNHEDLLA